MILMSTGYIVAHKVQAFMAIKAITYFVAHIQWVMKMTEFLVQISLTIKPICAFSTFRFIKVPYQIDSFFAVNRLESLYASVWNLTVEICPFGHKTIRDNDVGERCWGTFQFISRAEVRTLCRPLWFSPLTWVNLVYLWMFLCAQRHRHTKMLGLFSLVCLFSL